MIEIKIKKLKLVEICHREISAEKIAVPISDIEEIKIKLIYKNLEYKDVVYFSKLEGNKKIKKYSEKYFCSTSTIKFNKNVVEKSIMEEILKTENVEALILIYDDDSYDFCIMPFVHQKTRIGIELTKTKNICQGIKEDRDLIELSFMDQNEAWEKITNGRNKEGVKNGKD